MARVTACKECGASYPTKSAASEYCSRPCRQTANNRRMTRGAELYDLFMALRFDRKRAAAFNIWTLICRLAMYWHEEDQQQRNGRPSWQDPARVIEKRPFLKSIRVGIDRTGRYATST